MWQIWKEKEEAETRYRADSLINTFEKSLNSPEAEKIPEDQKKQTQAQIDEIKKLLEEKKYSELKAKLDLVLLRMLADIPLVYH